MNNFLVFQRKESKQGTQRMGHLIPSPKAVIHVHGLVCLVEKLVWRVKSLAALFA